MSGYTAANVATWIERSLKNLKIERLDLVQLHCPLTGLCYHPEVFEALDGLVSQGKIANYGVSVEKIEEGIKPSNIRTSSAFRSSTMFYVNALKRYFSSWRRRGTSR